MLRLLPWTLLAALAAYSLAPALPPQEPAPGAAAPPTAWAPGSTRWWA